MSVPSGFISQIDRLGPGFRLGDYWAHRARQHTHDSYLGVPISKFPEDLRVYEHLIWTARCDVVVELGADAGGSALWFRDRLEATQRFREEAREPLVVSVDIDPARSSLNQLSRRALDGIERIAGDLADPEVVARVRSAIPSGSRVLVVEDSAHDEASTRAALENYADLVPDEGFFVVEDGCVDVEWMRIDDTWPRGVSRAIDSWLASPSGSEFAQRRDLELYGMTCHPGGILQRANRAVPDPRASTRQATEVRELPMFTARPWQMTYGERAALEGLLAQVRPTLAIEIGTAEGGSLSRVAHWSEEVHSFDLVVPQEPVAGLANAHFHTGDAHDLLPEFLADLADAGRNVDFVLVDGDHTADGVERDIRDLLESDSINETLIAVHDTINPDVRSGLERIDYSAIEKVRAVDLDAVPGTMSIQGDYRGHLWGGIGVIACSRSGVFPDGTSPIVANSVSPLQIGLGARALAGFDVARDTDFAALVEASRSRGRRWFRRNQKESA